MMAGLGISKAVLAIALGAAVLARQADLPYDVERPLGVGEPDIPADNPLTVARVELGRRLFFDTSLSRSGKTSCATCHDPAHGFAERRSLSQSDGGTLQERNAPTVINAGYIAGAGWDGRFRTLEEQAIDPFSRRGDMGVDIDEALDVIARDASYPAMFSRAYHTSPTVRAVAQALAAFERSLVSGNTRFDRYLYGGEKGALNQEEELGMSVFLNRANCINCHDVFHHSVNPLGGAIALFTDHRFHNLGVGYANGVMRDVGRYKVTNDSEDWGAFRTPTLRNVALTAPYMHDGSFETLEEVVEFYDKGGYPNRNLSPSMRSLNLTIAEKKALVAFLKTLTDQRYEQWPSGR